MTDTSSSNVKPEDKFSNKKPYKIKQEFLENPDSSNDTGKYECFVKGCDLKFAFKELRVIHAKLKHGEKISCPLEGCESRIQPVSMDNHLRRHGLVKHEKRKDADDIIGSNKLLCDNCGKFITKDYLNGHKSTCTEGTKKEFVCDVEDCGKAFKNGKFLYTHKHRVHIEPVKCPFPDCNSYMKPTSRALHIKTVHEKFREMRMCKKCAKPIWVYKWKMHIEKCSVIFDVKSFKCEVENCTKSFKTKYDLSSHVRTLHKEPIKCPIENCDLYLIPKYIPLHIKKKHSSQNDMSDL